MSRSVVSPGKRPEDLIAYLETLTEPHILIAEDYRIVAANAAYRRAFAGHTSIEGRTCFAVSHGYAVPCDQAGETCPLARARLSGVREHVLHRHHTAQGETYVQIELTRLRSAGSEWFIEKVEPLTLGANIEGQNAMAGQAPAFLAMLDLIARVGPSTASVLLLGESSSGKELAARAIHAASPRQHKAFVVVDCASLTGTLFESELFGHQKGAFTGALAAKPGLVEIADGGTLFLDEVGDIPQEMQVKLLRLIETGTYRRVGSTELRTADLRLVSATHRDLATMVREGLFREDLYHRISVFPIRLPALRERRQDIPELAAALLQRIGQPKPKRLSRAALDRLSRHDFPGNIRELRNVLERASLLCDVDEIDLPTIERALSMSNPVTGPSANPPRIRARLADQELLEVAANFRGSRRQLAALLGLSERTLYRRLRALGMAQDIGRRQYSRTKVDS